MIPTLASNRSGGPQPWINEPRSHFHQLEVEGKDDKNAVDVSSRIESSVGNNFAFVVKCQKLGVVDLVLTVGNKKSATLLKPGSTPLS